MSKYNTYADQLNKAFQTASIKTREAIEAYQTAEKNRSIKYTGESDYQRAKDNLQAIRREVWPEFQKTRDQLGRQLQKEVETDQSLNPDNVDQNAITLLNAGLAKADDLESMAAKYREADNLTMLRVIGKKAGEMADKENDPATRHKLTMLSYNATARPAVLESWDNLVGVSKHYSGEYSRDAEPELITSLAKHWEGDGVQAAIRDF